MSISAKSRLCVREQLSKAKKRKFDFVGSRACSQTAEDCRCYNASLSVSLCLRESPCFYIAGTAFAPLFAALGLGVRIWFGETAHSRLNFGSARRAAPTIFFDSRGFASFAGLLPKRHRTTVATMLPSVSLCLRERPFETLRGRQNLGGGFEVGLR
jgi:hypothetical protein